MSVSPFPVRTGVRAVTIIGAMTATVVLSACSATGQEVLSAVTEPQSTLRAAVDSDLLAHSAPLSFRVDDLASGAMIDAVGDPVTTIPLHASGKIVVEDGVLTTAHITATAAALATVTFQLTDPLVLRREEDPASPLSAVGTLSFGNTQVPNSRVLLEPDLDAEGGTIVATMNLPESIRELSEVAAGSPGSSLRFSVSVSPSAP